MPTDSSRKSCRKDRVVSSVAIKWKDRAITSVQRLQCNNTLSKEWIKNCSVTPSSSKVRSLRISSAFWIFSNSFLFFLLQEVQVKWEVCLERLSEAHDLPSEASQAKFLFLRAQTSHQPSNSVLKIRSNWRIYLYHSWTLSGAIPGSVQPPQATLHVLLGTVHSMRETMALPHAGENLNNSK